MTARGGSRRRRGVARTGGFLVLLAALVVAVVAALPGSSRPSDRAFSGDGFATVVPRGWSKFSYPVTQVETVSLASAPVRPSDNGIPAPDAAALTFQTVSPTAIDDSGESLGGRPPLQVIAQIIGFPTGESALTVVTPVHLTTLGGAPAAAVVYRYRYRGLLNVQSDIVGVRGDDIVVIETDTQPSHEALARAALRAAAAHWQWRAPSFPVPAPVAPRTRAAIDSLLRTYAVAQERHDYAAVCRLFTPGYKGALEQAAFRLAGVRTTACPVAITALKHALGRVTPVRGTPHITSLAVTGRQGQATYQRRIGAGLVVTGAIAVIHTGAGWRIFYSTPLTVTGHQAAPERHATVPDLSPPAVS